MFAAMAWYVRDLVMGRCDRAHPLKDSRGSEWFDADFSYMFDKIKSDEDAFQLQGCYTECLMKATGYGTQAVDPLKFVVGIN
jgi:hypothetical protein